MAVPGGFQAGTAAIPSSQVEISVSCRNLRDCDVMSKSDPMCVLFQKDARSEKYFEVGRSEIIQDNLNPDFAKKFVMSYFFEESQKLKFEIYDVDSPSSRLDHHDFLGSLETTLGEIVGSPGSKSEKPLRGPVQNNGNIILRVEELSSCKEIATMHFKATNLDKKDWFGKSDPFLVFHRANEDGSYTVVHRTEVIKNTLNPTWHPLTVPVRQLCNGDYDRSIRVEVFDWNRDGSHEIIGEFTTNMRTLSQGPGENNQYEVVNPQKKSKKKYKNSGQVALLTIRIEAEHSFLDFVKGGMQMNFTVAIDFTASNGNPQAPNSLHYQNPYQLNQYALAITSVGEIIQDYDSDKMFPALGFGARMPDGNVSHEFALNFNPSYPFCEGVQGVLQAYYTSLQRVQLYGPTNFAPVINHVAKFAAAKRDGSEYFVLLIITDGIITDMPQTTEAIVRAASLPMSIIIVGVGNADFEAMNVLDGDDVRLSYKGKYAERDIVQFVPLRQFLVGGAQGQPVQTCQAALAKEVLAEIPDQVVGYMKKYNIIPRPPPPSSHVQGTAPPPYQP
ncbi:copine-8-like [Littorina saxatilis]|uniref:Copine-8 n=1 Tax=Littorina saxatilis TaxID=31220 RepID=A0AAN9GBK8_9CAEN